MRRVLVFVFLLHSFSQLTFSQNDSLQPSITRKRKIAVSTFCGVMSGGSLLGLNQLWYKQYRTGKFHFFDDKADWLQMDKVGHLYSNYVISEKMMDIFEWAGYSKNQKLFIGGGMGFAYMTAIEMMDGYSKGWGFSMADELCNLIGASTAVFQEGLWGRQYFRLKISYAESGLAKYRPSILGNSAATKFFKDYNGQTYWLSFNPFVFGKPKKWFPQWLSLSLGYGAYGMLGGRYNPIVVIDEAGNVIKFERERRFYLSLDVDFSRIKTKSAILKKIFWALNIVKFPAPALQFSNNKLRGYLLYY